MFTILNVVDGGGFGKVYKAKNNYDQAEFAIKEILFKGKIIVLSKIFIYYNKIHSKC